MDTIVQICAPTGSKEPELFGSAWRDCSGQQSRNKFVKCHVALGEVSLQELSVGNPAVLATFRTACIASDDVYSGLSSLKNIIMNTMINKNKCKPVCKKKKKLHPPQIFLLTFVVFISISLL